MTMPMPDPKSLIDTATAALGFGQTLAKIILEAKRQGNELAIADIIERLPLEAFKLSGQYIRQLEELKQSLLDAKVDITKSFDELEAERDWWRYKKWRAVRAAFPKINAISYQFSAFLDDVVAIAQCREAEGLIAASYKEILPAKNAIRENTKSNYPVEKVLGTLLAEAENLRAIIGDLQKK